MLSPNFNPNACYDDASCVAVFEGCIDSNALNYDAEGNTNDDTCYYHIGCMDFYGFKTQTYRFCV